VTAGTAFNFTLTALDASNDIMTGYSGTVHLTSTDAAAVLPADVTLTNGTGTFSATLLTVGSQSISATDTVTPSISDTSNGITVIPPPPTVTSISPSAGAITGGTAVTITGTNFTGATAVKFGATNAASFTVDSATQITATSPAGSAGAVDVTVVTPGGPSATIGAGQFAYVVRQTTPVPAAAGGGTVAVQITGGSPSCTLDPATGPIAAPANYNGMTPPLGALRVKITGCGNGDTVTVTATFSNLSGMSALKYGNTPTSPNTPVWYTPNGLTVNPNTGVITYTVTDNGLGDDTFSGADGIINDPVVPLPAPTNPTGIPTLNEWGVLTLIVLMAVFAAGAVRQRRVLH